MAKDYGRRPYISTAEEDYKDMMSRWPSSAMDSYYSQPHSEYEKPYQEDDYHEMEHYDRPPLDDDYLPEGVSTLPAESAYVPSTKGVCTIACEPYLGNIHDDPVTVWPVDQCTVKKTTGGYKNYFKYTSIYGVNGKAYVRSWSTRGELPKADIWIRACDENGYASIYVDGYDLCSNQCWAWCHVNCCFDSDPIAIDKDLSDGVITPGGSSAEIWIDSDNPGTPRYLAEIEDEGGQSGYYFFDAGLTLQEKEYWTLDVGATPIEVWAKAGACPYVIVKITDACEEEAEHTLRSTAGHWSAECTCCDWEFKTCGGSSGGCSGKSDLYLMENEARGMVNEFDYMNGSSFADCCGTCCNCVGGFTGYAYVCASSQTDGCANCFCGAAGYFWNCA